MYHCCYWPSEQYEDNFVEDNFEDIVKKHDYHGVKFFIKCELDANGQFVLEVDPADNQKQKPALKKAIKKSASPARMSNGKGQ